MGLFWVSRPRLGLAQGRSNFQGANFVRDISLRVVLDCCGVFGIRGSGLFFSILTGSERMAEEDLVWFTL